MRLSRPSPLETFVRSLIGMAIGLGLALYVLRWAVTADASDADVLEHLWSVLP